MLLKVSFALKLGENTPSHMEPPYYALLRLAMQGVLPATIAELLKLHAVRVIAAAFFGSVVTFLAFGAGHVNYDTNFFFSHFSFPQTNEGQ